MNPHECLFDFEIFRSAGPDEQVSEECGLRVCMLFCFSNLNRHQVGALSLVDADKKASMAFWLKRGGT